MKRRLPIFLLAVFIFLVSACTTVPVEQPAKTTPNLELLQQRFQEGKALFLNKQYAEAAGVLLPLAQQGHLDAQYTVGYMYFYGHGLPRNLKEANRWITTAAARGHAKAQEALQMMDAQQSPQATPAP
jgi:TPR repeat protein